MPKKPQNQIRSVHFHFLAGEEEAAKIRGRMSSVGMTCLGAYFRNMALDGLFVQLDLSDIHELVVLLRRCSNNLPQIAKHANDTHNICASDIAGLRSQYDNLWSAANSIMQNLAKIKA
jgi:hypothetical protein